MHFLKKALIVLGIALIGLVGYQFQKKEKLDNYFIEQFTMDYLIQSSRNEKNCHGEIFEKAVKDMERKGYSQDQIYKSMVKGFDKANTILQQQSQDQYLG
jgi:hypothetical protein